MKYTKDNIIGIKFLLKSDDKEHTILGIDGRYVLLEHYSTFNFSLSATLRMLNDGSLIVKNQLDYEIY